MRSYAIQQIFNKTRDFFHENKWLVATCACLCIFGFILGFLIYTPQEELTYEIGLGRALLWCVITLIVPYVLTTLPTINRYFLLVIPIAFLYLGARFGKGAEYLYASAGLKGLTNFFFIYLPILVISFLLITVNTAYSIIAIATTCPEKFKTILLRLLLLFAINFVVILLFLLIFGNLFEIIIIDC